MDAKENQEMPPVCAEFKAWDNEADHDFEHFKTLGRCLNQYRCRKCKQFLIVDSGD